MVTMSESFSRFLNNSFKKRHRPKMWCFLKSFTLGIADNYDSFKSNEGKTRNSTRDICFPFQSWEGLKWRKIAEQGLSLEPAFREEDLSSSGHTSPLVETLAPSTFPVLWFFITSSLHLPLKFCLEEDRWDRKVGRKQHCTYMRTAGRFRNWFWCRDNEPVTYHIYFVHCLYFVSVVW